MRHEWSRALETQKPQPGKEKGKCGAENVVSMLFIIMEVQAWVIRTFKGLLVPTPAVDRDTFH